MVIFMIASKWQVIWKILEVARIITQDHCPWDFNSRPLKQYRSLTPCSPPLPCKHITLVTILITWHEDPGGNFSRVQVQLCLVQKIHPTVLPPDLKQEFEPQRSLPFQDADHFLNYYFKNSYESLNAFVIEYQSGLTPFMIILKNSDKDHKVQIIFVLVAVVVIHSMIFLLKFLCAHTMIIQMVTLKSTGPLVIGLQVFRHVSIRAHDKSFPAVSGFQVAYQDHLNR